MTSLVKASAKAPSESTENGEVVWSVIGVRHRRGLFVSYDKTTGLKLNKQTIPR